MIGIIKLITGEEIIGECFPTDGFVHIKYPMTFSHYSNEEGHSMNLNKYCQWSEKDAVTIKDSLVVYVLEASESITEYYTKSVEYDRITNSRFHQSIRKATLAMDTMINNAKTKSKTTDSLTDFIESLSPVITYH